MQPLTSGTAQPISYGIAGFSWPTVFVTLGLIALVVLLSYLATRSFVRDDDEG